MLRHSAAHIMAQAVKRLYPHAHFAYGPATENGFHYDIDLGDTMLGEDDLASIEGEMKRIVKENLPFKAYSLPREEAVRLMQERGEEYKVEHIGDLPEDAVITFYQQGEYFDMCKGPHLTYTKALKAFKLTAVSGAYWKNKQDNKMLTRINGVAFFSKEELEDETFVLRPMNCPHHMMIYANQLHSYRDLPIRIGEIAHDFRFEPSGTLKGIERGRHFCQNDAHLFVTPEQIKEEVWTDLWHI